MPPDPLPGNPPGPFLVSLRPAAGAVGVDRNFDFAAEFDGPVDPDSVSAAIGSVRLFSGPAWVAGSVRVDPVRWTLHFSPLDPRQVLPNAAYRFEVMPGIRGINGSPIRGARAVTFTTAADYSPSVPCVADVCAQVASPLARSCAAPGTGCHEAADPVVGQDLSTLEGIRRTAVGVRSAEWGSYRRPWERIEPFRPDWSYLVYKMVGEIPELIGEQMPAGCSHSSTCFALEDIEPIACWIQEGAVAVPDCPATGNDPAAPAFRITSLWFSSPAALGARSMAQAVNVGLVRGETTWLLALDTTGAAPAVTTGSGTTAGVPGQYRFEAGAYLPRTVGAAASAAETFETTLGALAVTLPVRDARGAVLLELPLREADLRFTMSSGRNCIGAEYGRATGSLWCADSGQLGAKIALDDARATVGPAGTLCDLLCGADCAVTLPDACPNRPADTSGGVAAWTVTASFAASAATIVP